MKKMMMLLLSIIMIAVIPLTSFADQEYFINGELSEETAPNENNDVKTLTTFNEKYHLLTDYPNGYSVCIPVGLRLDTTLSPYKVSAYDDTMLIEFYYDDFNGSATTAVKYISDSNFFIRNNTIDHKKELETWLYVKGYKAHILKWSRSKLSRVENDKNYYVSAEIIKNEKEVYTIFIKSANPINGQLYTDIVNSFTIMEKKGTPYLKRTPAVNNTLRWNKETNSYFNSQFLKAGQFTWGLYDVQFHVRWEPLEALEGKLDYKFNILLRYNVFPEYENVLAIKNTLDRAHYQNRVVELSLQTLYIYHTKNGNVVYDILDGKYDAVLSDYAEVFKEYGHPVLFRLNNEMNGSWCKYSAYYTSKDTEIYKDLYHYIYNYFSKKGVNNVVYIWNPNDKSFPNYKWNDAFLYYPGDEYVDLVGLTGYNTGTSIAGEKWRNFTQIYDPLYASYEKLFSQPFIIGEFACGNTGGSKVDWIKEMFANMNKYSRIKAAVWWNYNDYDKNWNPLRTYRLDENDDTLNAFRQGLWSYNNRD